MTIRAIAFCPLASSGLGFHVKSHRILRHRSSGTSSPWFSRSNAASWSHSPSSLAFASSNSASS
eukprot:9459995-Lingulodinium_polyedra.AAC.1